MRELGRGNKIQIASGGRGSGTERKSSCGLTGKGGAGDGNQACERRRDRRMDWDCRSWKAIGSLSRTTGAFSTVLGGYGKGGGGIGGRRDEPSSSAYQKGMNSIRRSV